MKKEDMNITSFIPFYSTCNVYKIINMYYLFFHFKLSRFI